MHFPSDYGYTTTPAERTVRVGDLFRERVALGIIEYEVLRPHRDAGYFECVHRRWVTEVPEFRQGFCGSIQVRSRSDILRLMYED